MLATPAERFQDYAAYHRYFKIIDRDTRNLVAFQPNDAQILLHDEITTCDAAGMPVRIFALKARQEGFSTGTQTKFGHRSYTRRNFHALTVSHEDESARTLWQIQETLYTNLPDAVRPPRIAKEQGRRLVLGNGSQLRYVTAGGDGDVGRSSGASALHLSEAAYYPNPEATAISAFNLVQDKPGTMIIVESTANGEGNWFHREWLRAVDGANGFKPIFLPWFADKGYTRPDLVPDGGLDDLDDEELELRSEHGATDAQLAWRRHTLKQPTYGGDVDRFHQEMPATPAEAFLSSGRPFFGSLTRRFTPVEPVKRGDWVLTGARKGAGVRFVEDPRGPCWMWELPVKDRRYVVTLDPAGKVTDRDAEAFASQRDSEDFSVITVTDCATQAEVCTWRDRRDPSLVALVLAGIGAVYNRATVSVENTGGYGGVALHRLDRELGYRNLHREERYDSVKRTLTKALGHDTTTTTRPRVLEALRDTLRDHPELLRDARLKDEMRVFHHGKDGIPRAQPGYHDDLVMARAWGIHLSRIHAQSLPKPRPVVESKRLLVAA